MCVGVGVHVYVCELGGFVMSAVSLTNSFPSQGVIDSNGLRCILSNVFGENADSISLYACNNAKDSLVSKIAACH